MTEAWRQFLAVDSTSRWADEARVRLRAAGSARPPPAPPANASDAELAAYAAHAPQEARLLGWDHLLGEWGAAVLHGDSATAEDRLRKAGAIGAALEGRGGDATLADAVRAIRTHAGERSALRTLARAHQMYTAGRAAFLAGETKVAGRSFRAAVERAERSPSLRQWALLYAGGALLQGGRTKDAERVFREVIAKADTVRYSALAAQSRWARGTALLRSGRYEESGALFSAAAALFVRIGESENVGAIHVLSASGQLELGDHPAVHRTMHPGLATLRPYRESVWLHNLLYIWGQTASQEGFTRAAVRIHNEDITVASLMKSPIESATARLARARLLTAAGDTVAAAQDIEASRTLIEQIAPGTMRDWVRADYWLAKAKTTVNSSPAYAETALDSVVAFFTDITHPARLLPALVARAEARLSIGKVELAEADLDRAVALLDDQQGTTGTASLRASLLEAARRTVDQLVMLRIAAGNPAEALAHLERGRTSFAPTGADRLRPASRRAAFPSRQVAVEYALIGDTLLIWTVADTTIRLTRSTIDRAGLTRTIDRVRAALELRASDSAVRPDLAVLYDQLVRPIESRLGPNGTPIIVVADGEIAAIPLAALYDRGRRQYLLESHSLRFASSLRELHSAGMPSVSRPKAVLFVSDPAFDRMAYPSLDRLPGAAAEVETIAAGYSQATVLAGPRASRERFLAALEHTSLVHYAGHAVFDDDRPAQSYLVLAASRAGGGTWDKLPAADIEQLDLRHIRLVVLSACRTSSAHNGRSGGFAGLTGALTAAGAGGVIGSQWRVDDGLTLPLMVEFHRAYRASSNSAEALRAAQLRMLRSSDPAQRSPSAWAGFRYTGL